MGRFSRFAGSRAGRTGDNAYVAGRESEDLRRLQSNQDEWAISSGDAYTAYYINDVAISDISDIRFLPIKTSANRISLSHCRAGFNTLAGKFALYFYENRKLKLIPGSEAIFEAAGSYVPTTVELSRKLKIERDARLFVGFIQTTTGTAVALGQNASVGGSCVTILSADGIIDFRKEIHLGDLSPVVDMFPFPDFAFLSPEAALVL